MCDSLILVREDLHMLKKRSVVVRARHLPAPLAIIRAIYVSLGEEFYLVENFDFFSVENLQILKYNFG